MAPLPGVPTKKSSSDNTDPRTSRSHSPSKKSKVEHDEEELDYGDEEEQDSGLRELKRSKKSWSPDPPTDERSSAKETRTRKKVPISLRLGNIAPMDPADTAKFINQLEGLDTKRERSTSASSFSPSAGQRSSPGYFEPETDPQVLARRQKQIGYGKNTLEYIAFCEAVPRNTREPQHPKTPNIARKYSRRAWDGLIRGWRRDIHLWNDPAAARLEMENRRREKLNESFCSETSEATTASTSTASFMSGDEEAEKTLVTHEISWYDEMEDDLKYQGTVPCTNLNKTLEQTTDDDEETVRVRL